MNLLRTLSWPGKRLAASGSGLRCAEYFGDRAQEQARHFEQLCAEHHRSLWRVAYRLSGDIEEAEDLLQESLLEAFMAFPRFIVGTHFDRWVFRIMRNTYLDRVRKRQKAGEEPLEAIPRIVAGLNSDAEQALTTKSADAELIARTLDGPIQKALDGLQPDYRLVVVLADIEDMSYEEIAAIVDCPVGTVRSRLHRGRAHLKAELKDYMANR